MTNQVNQEFEKWLKENYPDYPPPLSEVWQAAQQQSAGEIAELKVRIGDVTQAYQEKVNELKADNERLREALEDIAKVNYTSAKCGEIAQKALKATP